ncbi:MAG: phosphoribosylformylglycinamidine synthase subunit PurQ [Acidobacteria bacterium]|nr:MAG: phosphoribosylformylglycinamidine synthase subunit PurQ [Acidobacteriota bacterium]
MSEQGGPLVAVIVFPGTNCELDVVWALDCAGGRGELVFHDVSDLSRYDGAILAGGFAHGDYLRPGAIARFSPVMDGLRELAQAGRPVVGICNGFQVLCEAGFLPGALQKNAGLTFICAPANLKVERTASALTSLCTQGQILENVPINHFEGNYTADEATLRSIEERGQVILRYCGPSGDTSEEWNPNGSANSIAGICNEAGNVVGLMPHPERAMEEITGSTSGRPLLESFVESARQSHGAALGVK